VPDFFDGAMPLTLAMILILSVTGFNETFFNYPYRMKKPYADSIWTFDNEYAPPPEIVGHSELRLIGMLQSIEAAKKRVAPIPVVGLLILAAKLKHPPKLKGLQAEQFADYLDDLDVYGAGIKTAVCMLAVASGGAFPPMDRKLVAGLREMGCITASEANALNGADVEEFAYVYVETVIPFWQTARQAGVDPRTIDEQWATGKPANQR